MSTHRARPATGLYKLQYGTYDTDYVPIPAKRMVIAVLLQETRLVREHRGGWLGTHRPNFGQSPVWFYNWTAVHTTPRGVSLVEHEAFAINAEIPAHVDEALTECLARLARQDRLSSPLDNVPWEIHMISDPAARAEATAAFWLNQI